jgi:uncharacterized membrane protein YsdA (DUF1294 family)/cold shock CspA family protein
MRQQGKLSEWDDARGFGFVQPNGGGERCFVHIRAFTARDRRPALGDVITYEVQRDARGRNNAVAVRFALQRGGTRAGTRAGTSRAPAAGRDVLPRTAIALVFLACVLVAMLAGFLPFWLAAVYFGLSGLTYLVYSYDKEAAQRDQQRTPEKILQMLALFGGWPGALIAQAKLRHKNRKASFQGVFWVVVVINLVALVWLLRGFGQV